MKLRATFELKCHEEDSPIEGNASAIDPATDRETETWIKRELARGNDWAWCWVKVTATVEVDGEYFIGVDTLGCCSYRSEAEFTQPGGYFDDMKAGALDDLRASQGRR